MLPTEPVRAPPVFGLLIVGTLIGAGLGYARVDLAAARQGHHAFDQFHYSRALAFTIGGAALGALLGALCDAIVKCPRRANRILLWARILLLVGVVLFGFLRPFFEQARE
jgi:hypothetical protein